MANCPMCGEPWNGEKCGVCGWYEPDRGVSSQLHQYRVARRRVRRKRSSAPDVTPPSSAPEGQP